MNTESQPSELQEQTRMPAMKGIALGTLIPDVQSCDENATPTYTLISNPFLRERYDMEASRPTEDAYAERATPSRRSREASFQTRSNSAGSEPTTAGFISQPETRPIIQVQLVEEVKGIYAGLVVIESKCIEVDKAQTDERDSKLNDDQWQALIALHRTLLHEHHDFSLASQHPSTSQALRKLATKYAMPARMWRHGIHSFLELLRQRLPDSLDHMLTSIYTAYSMIALLYETVPALEDTWIECLGDLGRYRMAIEDDDPRDNEVWGSVTRHWYSKASDKVPAYGRLCHHLAILARPNAVQQLFYYTKPLHLSLPFRSARESIMTLFDPILAPFLFSQLLLSDTAMARSRGTLFDAKVVYGSDRLAEFMRALDGNIRRTASRWIESGYFLAVTSRYSLLSYGPDNHLVMRAIRDPPMLTSQEEPWEGTAIKARAHERALQLNVGTRETLFNRLGDANGHRHLHRVASFIYHLSQNASFGDRVIAQPPWKFVAMVLNISLLMSKDLATIRDEEIPRPMQVFARPLPEDYAMRGLFWGDNYYPVEWFSNYKLNDDDQKYVKIASMTDERRKRSMWLGCCFAQPGRWLPYDDGSNHLNDLTFEYDTETMNICEFYLTTIIPSIRLCLRLMKGEFLARPDHSWLNKLRAQMG